MEKLSIIHGSEMVALSGNGKQTIVVQRMTTKLGIFEVQVIHESFPG